jgi:superoxide dismutase
MFFKSFVSFTILSCLCASTASYGQTTFALPALSYSYAALEPVIDSQTMLIHHTKHHQAYITNLNKALEKDTLKRSIEDILKAISTYPVSVRNNGGGHYNHSLFWSILSPDQDTKPSKALNDAIIKHFGSLDSLKKLINSAALKQFGSGWAWLSVSKENELFISATPNQDNPLMDIAERRGTPILGIDIWEHAYYLKYQNKRGDYLSSIWAIINWQEVSRRYSAVPTIEK